jgi:hypothetical protein
MNDGRCNIQVKTSASHWLCAERNETVETRLQAWDMDSLLHKINSWEDNLP